MKVSKPFKLKPRAFKVKPRSFRIRPKNRNKQYWFTPLPQERIISIRDLNPEQDFAFSKYFPDKGGLRTITASGAAIQRSWASALKRMHKPNGLEKFIAAFYVRPSNKCKVNEPQGRWREVVLHPRRDLYFMIQPMDRKHYGRQVQRV